jgi:hypothetical protein
MGRRHPCIVACPGCGSQGGRLPFSPNREEGFMRWQPVGFLVGFAVAAQAGCKGPAPASPYRRRRLPWWRRSLRRLPRQRSARQAHLPPLTPRAPRPRRPRSRRRSRPRRTVSINPFCPRRRVVRICLPSNTPPAPFLGGRMRSPAHLAAFLFKRALGFCSDIGRMVSARSWACRRPMSRRLPARLPSRY